MHRHDWTLSPPTQGWPKDNSVATKPACQGHSVFGQALPRGPREDHAHTGSPELPPAEALLET